MGVYKVFMSVCEGVYSGVYTLKNSTNTRKKRTCSIILGCLSGVVVVFALATTLLHKDPILQLILYIIGLGLFIASDPLELFFRFLSTQSRILIFIDCILTSSMMVAHDWTYTLVAILLILASIALIRCLNRKWIVARNWLMTTTVERVTSELENESTLAWQGHGKREARTLLHELGHEPNEDVLDIFVKPIYVLGHLHGSVKSGNIEELQESTRGTKKELKELKREYDELAEDYSLLNRKYEQLEEESIDEYNDLADRYNELLEAYERLEMERNVQEEKEKPNIEQIEAIEEKTEEEQIQELLEKGYSIRKAAAELDIPNCRVYKVSQRMKGE